MNKRLVAILALAWAINASLAFADGVVLESTEGLELLTIVPIATSSGGFQWKAEYVQNVQDDAAAFLAGGDESALLAQAIREVRIATHASDDVSDSEIAARIARAVQ